MFAVFQVAAEWSGSMRGEAGIPIGVWVVIAVLARGSPAPARRGRAAIAARRMAASAPLPFLVFAIRPFGATFSREG